MMRMRIVPVVLVALCGAPAAMAQVGLPNVPDLPAKLPTVDLAKVLGQQRAAVRRDVGYPIEIDPIFDEANEDTFVLHGAIKLEVRYDRGHAVAVRTLVFNNKDVMASTASEGRVVLGLAPTAMVVVIGKKTYAVRRVLDDVGKVWPMMVEVMEVTYAERFDRKRAAEIKRNLAEDDALFKRTRRGLAPKKHR